MKKYAILFATLLAVASVSGCGGASSSAAPSASASTAPAPSTPSFNTTKEITVISREDGSGTRSAFTELLEILQKDASGNKQDMTTQEAIIANKTDVMLQNVSGDPYAIGYVSMGSLNDSVKALRVEGIEATSENVKNGSYPVARPFYIATKGAASGLAKDFIRYILSLEGQQVVAKSYIAVDDQAAAFKSSGESGKLVIAGSSSVSPVMEKLVEAYKVINPNATVELQISDSSAGMNGAMEGTCDIGMASRDLKESELAKLTATQIAIDGIAVVVNTANENSALTKEQIKNIYTGAVTTWEQASK